MRQWTAHKDVTTEAEEPTVLEANTKQRLVKAQKIHGGIHNFWDWCCHLVKN
jgi:hypothetical protein